MSEFLLPRPPAANIIDRAATDADELRERGARESRRPDEVHIRLGEFGESRTMDVLGGRHGLQVIRTDAGKNSTQMIDLFPRRDRPDELLVRSAVCQGLLAADADPAVTVRVGRPNADPAWRDEAPVFLSPEIGRESTSLGGVSDVSADEPHMPTRNVSDPSVRFLGDRSDPAASALAVHRHIVTNSSDGIYV